MCLIHNMPTWYIFLFFLMSSATLAYKSYEGYKVLETEPLTEESVKSLNQFITDPLFDFWIKPQNGRNARITLAPDVFDFAKTTLDLMGIKTNMIISDVNNILGKERIKMLKQKNITTPKLADFTKYYTLDEILKYINDVVSLYPKIASVIDIGTSSEGRPMRVLKLSSGPGKAGIFFDSAMHAREWLTIPTVMYAIHELTENLINNQGILDKNDFYFLLVGNPDGYDYSHKVDRLTRNTRSNTSGDSLCIGADPNRNFDQAWNDGVDDACMFNYRGSAPFSEPEVESIANFINKTTNITSGISVHACGQYLTYPFGNSSDSLPPNVEELERVGKNAVKSLAQVVGNKYKLGRFANLLYKAFGTSTDWYYVKQGMSLSYTIELPCGEGPPGPDGHEFELHPSLILPVAIETWEAYKVFAANIPEKRIYFE